LGCVADFAVDELKLNRAQSVEDVLVPARELVVFGADDWKKLEKLDFNPDELTYSKVQQ